MGHADFAMGYSGFAAGKRGWLTVPLRVMTIVNRQQDCLAVKVLRSMRIIPLQSLLVSKDAKVRLQGKAYKPLWSKVVDHLPGGFTHRCITLQSRHLIAARIFGGVNFNE